MGSNKRQKTMKFFSMFSGVGGFEIGIQKAMDIKQSSKNSELPQQVSWGKRGERSVAQQQDGIHVERDDTASCVGVCEWDKYSSQVLKKRFAGVKNYGDATKIIPTDLPDFDMLVGGFPCQSFSIAGKRGGFNDTRGTMFFEIARLLEIKRPKYCVLENVKGLLSHDKGKTFATILCTLQELGYCVEFGVLNSRYFGVPQNRERVFIIGSLTTNGGSRTQVFPLQRTNGSNTGKIEKVANINPSGRGMNGCVYSAEGISPTVSTNKGEGHKIIHNIHGGFGESEPRVFKEFSPSIRTAAGGGHIPYVMVGENEYVAIRKLTPLECERLQGFPDDFTKIVVSGKEGEFVKDKDGYLEPTARHMSDTQRYKMMGNAVTTNVVEAIMKKLFAGSVKL